jgi:antitoxin VapB
VTGAAKSWYPTVSFDEVGMINLSKETIALAGRLAEAQGISIEDAIKQAVEQRARQAGVTVQPHWQRDLSAGAVAARKAHMNQIAEEIAAMPVLDLRSPREIMDDLNAL